MTAEQIANMIVKGCKHDHGFRFHKLTAADRLPGVFGCNLGCGYSLPFNPETFPDGIAYLEGPRQAKVVGPLSQSHN